MKPPENGARMTISAVAARQFFDPDETNGLRVNIDNDRIAFRSTRSQSGASVIGVEHRKRGGISVVIDPNGTHSADLLRLFRKAGFRTSEPFFLLQQRRRGGWVDIEHYDSPNPPIAKPHLRVWMNERATRGRPPVAKGKPVARQAARGRPPKESKPIGELDWLQIRQALNAAQAVLKQRGRPTQEIAQAREQAREDIDQFERLAAVIGISGGSARNDRLFREAREERDTVIEERDTAIHERDAAIEERNAALAEVQSLQRLLDQAETPRKGRSRLHRPQDEPVEDEPVEDEAPRRRSRKRRNSVVEPVEAEDIMDEPVISDVMQGEPEPESVDEQEVQDEGDEPVDQSGEEPDKESDAESDQEESSEVEAEGEPEATDESGEAVEDADEGEEFTDESVEEVTDGGVEVANEPESDIEPDEPEEQSSDESDKGESPDDDQPPSRDMRFPNEDK